MCIQALAVAFQEQEMGQAMAWQLWASHRRKVVVALRNGREVLWVKKRLSCTSAKACVNVWIYLTQF